MTKQSYYSIKDCGLSSYFDLNDKSSLDDFESAKTRCLSFLNRC